MTPSSGRILFDGRDITGLPQHAVVRLGIALVLPDHQRLPAPVGARERARGCAGPRPCLHFCSRADRLREVSDQATALLESVGLNAKRHMLAAHLSHGETRHLEIGKGRIQFEETPGQLRNDPTIQQRFLEV
jgi:branched-chain amino acid transport system ATP-binding protein